MMILISVFQYATKLLMVSYFKYVYIYITEMLKHCSKQLATVIII